MCENVAAAAAVGRVESRHLTVVMPSHLIGTHDFCLIWDFTHSFGSVLLLVHTPSRRHASWIAYRTSRVRQSARGTIWQDIQGFSCPSISFVCFRFVYSTLFSFSSEQRNTPTKCNTNSYYLIVLFVLGKLSKFSLFSNSTKCSIPVLQMFSVCSDWCSCQVCFTHLR